MSVVDSAYYVKGERVSDDLTVEQALSRASKRGPSFAWIDLERPDADELQRIGDQFGVHHLVVDAMGRRRARTKVEEFGEDLVLVVHAAHYNEEKETVEFDSVYIVVSDKAVLTVRRTHEPDLGEVRREIEDRRELLARGSRAVLWAVLNHVVQTYDPVLDGLENDIDEIEAEVFSYQPAVEVSRRIYELHRQIIAFQRTVSPLVDVLQEVRDNLDESDEDLELKRLFRDLQGHVVRVGDRVDNFRSLLDKVLDAHGTITSQRQTETSIAQNEQAKKISAWAAILYLPSMIGSIYGMNFRYMPELDWRLGYPMAVGLMLVASASLFVIFRKKGWL
ncbi:magnesium and cobalt transport protein CorA [Demequina sp. TTPB684]|uniref:magnesium and cobalt transport protein CorA n=1 Tax=unclassified Demequina TaxID=2620311 RepID=UPI001CF128D7|nr:MULTISPECIES: magnesium and cobalt transport protein CorA [unclassified Demequina]MCB2412326.1 magnesium and cobalt transport protein CorA [Demequina sp. TTPB684]UPU89479.1 magnesium and cobalt transport protein CorA [Demequina sp. TMPB413]